MTRYVFGVAQTISKVRSLSVVLISLLEISLAPMSHASLAAIDQQIAALQADLDKLKLQAAEIRSHLSNIIIEVNGDGNQVHINYSDGGTAPCEGASVRAPPEAPPAPPATSPPPIGSRFAVARGPPGQKLRKYYVLTASSKPDYPVGIYVNFEDFGNACRDPDIHWSGRGHWSWALGAEGQGFASKDEAENHYREKCDKEGVQPIPYRY